MHSWRPCIYLPARTSGLRDFLAAFALPAPAQTTCITPDSAGKCVPGLFHQGSPPTPFLAGEEKTDQWLEFLPVYLCVSQGRSQGLAGIDSVSSATSEKRREKK